MKPDTPLDSVVFQLDESRSRCELWVAAGESTERLASGSLMPFLAHLDTAQEQLANDCSSIELHCPHQGASWFTKRTIERFVRFVSTPDVLERVSFLETERMKLAEASSILISESPHVGACLPLPVLESGNAGKEKVEQAKAQAHAEAEEHSMDTLEVETESSRRHLVKAMDARRLILEKEQRSAFARAAAAGFTIGSLPDLIAFAGCFGATRLSEACSKFAELHRKLLDPDVPAEKLEEKSDTRASTKLEEKSETRASTKLEEKLEVEVQAEVGVKNVGRRRVWGPPVAEIPLQMPLERVNGSVPESEGPDWKDGAFTPDDSDSPQKSTASGGRESDWEDKEGSSENPVYANVLGQLSGKDADSGEAGEAKSASNQVDASAVRRKGIVVIKNLKFPQTGASSIIAKQSDTESDRDSENETKGGSGGRLSVQAAISLFETKQKTSREVSRQQVDTKNVDRKTSDPPTRTGKQDPAASDGHKYALKHKHTPRELLSDDVKRKSMLTESLQLGLPKRDRDFILQKSSLDSKGQRGHTKMDAVNDLARTRKEQVDRTQKEGGSRQNTTAKTADEIRKELLSRTQQRTGASNQSTVKSADEISKELLDRSYTCLLKINSVVQDALFSASALRQTKKPEQPKANVETDSDSREWRSLSNVSKFGLDDIFLENNVSTKEASRRQSLCTPAEYDGKANSDDVMATRAPHEHEKGRFYDQYQEIRAAKYKKESTHLKAERESKLRAMQDVLERRKTELMGKSTRLPEKNNTMTVEQIRAIKLQATKNVVKKDVRLDSIKALQNEKSGTRTRTSNVLRCKQESSPSSTTSSTRKISPGPPKPLATPRNFGRLSSSPRSKHLSSGPPVSQRRMPNFMSQSVIAESLHTQADLRKENAKPFTGRNSLNTIHEAGQPSRYSQSRADKVNRNLALETSPSNGEIKRLGGKGRTDARDSQILAPLKVPRDLAPEKGRVKQDLPKAQGVPRIVIPRPSNSPVSSGSKPGSVPEPKCEAGKTGTVERSTPVSSTKSSDECIKQIVSCTSKDRNEQAPEDNPSKTLASPGLPAEAPQVSLVITNVKSESFKEQPKSEEPYTSSEIKFEAFVSKDFEDDVQIDEALEKCMSGRSFLDGISASPLTTYETTTTLGIKGICCSKQDLISSSLRTGPSSQSLPHLQRSLSPSSLASFRNDFAAKEIKALCKEHHQPVAHKDQPKGLKRLLKFGRRSRASDSNAGEWSTFNEDFIVNSTRSSKKNAAVEEPLPRTAGSSAGSSVRRSLEALPKIADAASEISRNFFSTFRSKSNASESRSRA
ncbi:uncharacterized protein LOC9631447 isoform X2 [Selaginella moellendorffii]|uniref:uncharacterized protein LOC9631447 isoform X2 n=1 Tax=Selaginella moellendorffii TaxID=88036 RepID=UPI000D1CD279|nr:uncharacterized protein LOC9631447 isoform X2 [Selaginella moellendorffii]|eukprot:XP_024529204.1 uncharacterized protein LOC9631447 isoform X2 [Selaginella moellendorffii]